MISNPTEFPDTSDTSSKVKQVQEPIVNASIIVPEGQHSFKLAKAILLMFQISEYMGEMMSLCFAHRAENLDHRYLDSGSTSEASARAILTCTLPLSEIVTDFFDQLKSRSSGYASFE
jgi:translation elongation factor EF-4